MLLCEHIQELHRAELESGPLGPPLSAGRMAEVEAALLLYLEIGG
jgi:hypothetical protein